MCQISTVSNSSWKSMKPKFPQSIRFVIAWLLVILNPFRNLATSTGWYKSNLDVRRFMIILVNSLYMWDNKLWVYSSKLLRHFAFLLAFVEKDRRRFLQSIFTKFPVVIVSSPGNLLIFICFRDFLISSFVISGISSEPTFMIIFLVLGLGDTGGYSVV